MSEILRPCPFCGGKADVKTTHPRLERIFCSQCGANTLWGYNSKKIWENRSRKNSFLKPCPLCAGKPKLYEAQNGFFCVQCQKCGITSNHCLQPKEAIKAWNRRVNP